MARPHSVPWGGVWENGVWDMSIEQFVAPHGGVHTNHRIVFNHMVPEVCD